MRFSSSERQESLQFRAKAPALLLSKPKKYAPGCTLKPIKCDADTQTLHNAIELNIPL
jgi:hypothetical protein